MSKELNNFMIGIKNYLIARNQVLWTGTWQEGSITVPGSDKYSAFLIRVVGRMCVCGIHNGNISGISVTLSAGVESQYINAFHATVKGNTWTMVDVFQMSHKSDGSHGSIAKTSTVAVTEIIGLEPKLSEFWLGGGVG